MTSLRPGGSGRPGTASIFLRQRTKPVAALVLCSDSDLPEDWAAVDGSTEGNLSHAAGWTCEVRKNDVVVMNPLGEGMAKAPVPELSPAWLENVRHDGSCAVFLAPAEAESGFAELTLSSAASMDALRGASVRTSVSAEYGAPPKLGRNEPCHCGSGRKFKHCHG